MKSNRLKYHQHLRVVWAITWKDILDGWKNKNILANLVVVTLMIVFYKTLPSWEHNIEVPNVLVYDAGKSSLVVALEDSTAVTLYQYDSHQEMERILAKGDIPELGLVIPADFDKSLEAREAVELDGYVVHWVSEEAAEELKQMAEAEITILAGKGVRVNLEGNKVYTQADSTGLAFLASISIIFSVAMVGLLVTPHLMIEEKRAKTIDALLVSPASISQVVVGKALAGLFYVIVAASVVFALNWPGVVHWEMVPLFMLGIGMFSVGVGLVLGSFFERQQDVVVLTMLLIVVFVAALFVSMLGLDIPMVIQGILPWVPSVALAEILRFVFLETIPWEKALLKLGSVLAISALLCALVVLKVRRSDR